MDWIQKLMNLVVPPLSFIIFLFIIPPFFLFKSLSCIINSIHNENVSGKVVLITGASSGIGEYLAYEYARRGARLVLAARREDRLKEVADKARNFGSPEVIVIPTDVSNIEHSKRLVHEAINHFGQLDHLVNNAGVNEPGMFEELDDSDCARIMDINFWGSVYSTRFAVPHLRKRKGKIIVISSTAGWLPVPRMSFYNASKAAIIAFFETLRIEFGSDIGITIVTPGMIESEMTTSESLSKIHMNFIPKVSTHLCAEAIVNSACRGERYLTEPPWVKAGFLWKVVCPEVLEWCSRLFLITNASRTPKRD